MNHCRGAVRYVGAAAVLVLGLAVLAVSVVSVVQLVAGMVAGRTLCQGETVAAVMLAVGLVGLVLVGCCDCAGFAQVAGRAGSVVRSLLSPVASRGLR